MLAPSTSENRFILKGCSFDPKPPDHTLGQLTAKIIPSPSFCFYYYFGRFQKVGNAHGKRQIHSHAKIQISGRVRLVMLTNNNKNIRITTRIVRLLIVIRIRAYSN